MNKLIIGILSILVFIPVKSAGQSVEMPSTPQNQWVFIITSIKDSISQEAVPLHSRNSRHGTHRICYSRFQDQIHIEPKQ